MTSDIRIPCMTTMILVLADGSVTELGSQAARLIYETATTDRGGARFLVEVDVPFGELGAELTISLPISDLSQIARCADLTS